jgi:hypothetical protein
VIAPVDVDRIEWHAPAECPDDAAVEARVGDMLGATTTNASERATADVVGDHEGWTVEIATFIDGAKQTRSLRADDCAVLAEAVAVVVAVALDPVAVATSEAREQGPRVPEPTIETPPTSAREVDRAPPQPRRTSAPPRRTWTFGLRVAGGYGIGTAPGGTGLVGLALFAQTGRARIEIEGRWYGPREILDDGTGARTQLGTAAALGCLELGRAVVTAPLCLGFEAGALRARGLRLPDPIVVNFPWAAPVARAALAARVHARVRMWLALEGAVLVVRPQLQQGFDDPEVLWQAPPVAARVMLGVEVRWWP